MNDLHAPRPLTTDAPADEPGMRLVTIAPPTYDVDIALAYATPDNVTGQKIYRHARCYLHEAAAEKLQQAIRLAAQLGLRFRIFDAFRPTEAQWVLWNKFPDPEFIADPRRGSPHSRGAAVDLTLLDAAGNELDMGTGFDDFTPLAHHGNGRRVAEASATEPCDPAGLMTASGWDFYRNEWWHYQLFDARKLYPLISDKSLKYGLM